MFAPLVNRVIRIEKHVQTLYIRKQTVKIYFLQKSSKIIYFTLSSIYKYITYNLLFRFSKYGKGFHKKILLTGSPEISEYFFAGLNDGGATILLSETKSLLVVKKTLSVLSRLVSSCCEIQRLVIDKNSRQFSLQICDLK